MPPSWFEILRGVWEVPDMSKGMRFSRRTVLMKMLMATETLRPTEEQKALKLRLSSASMRAMIVATDIYNQLLVVEVISIVSLRYIWKYRLWLIHRVTDSDIGRRAVIENQVRWYKADILSIKSEQFIDTNIINANCDIRRRSIDAVYERVNGTWPYN